MTATRGRVLVVMCAGYFLVLLDVTIVNVALPRLGSGLHAGVSDLQWVVDGYAIALASLMLAGGTIGDIRGHRRVVVSGFVLFGIASLACGLAPNMGVLIAARVLQGAGAALLLPGTLAIIADAFPDDAEQARAIGIWAGVGSAALPAGPIAGGALVEALGWRAVFFVNLPIVLVALAVTLRTVRESRRHAARRLDVAGAALGAATLALTTFSLIEIGRSGVDAASIAAAVLGAAALVAFLSVERSRRDAMLPLPLFRRPAFSAANGVAGTMNLGTLGVLFVITLYLQRVQGHSTLVAGVELLPLFLPLALLAPFAGRVTARAGPRRPMVAGLIGAAAGLALLTALGTGSGYATLLPALVLWGCGLAALTPAVVAAAIQAVPPDRSGLASAVNNTARQAGGAVGIAAFGAIAGAPEHRGD